MLNDSQNKEEVKKKRYLNIIYFFDGSKTKTLRLPTIPVKILISLVFAMSFWFIAATFFLVASINEQYLLYKRLHSFSEGLLQYQIKYDSVYERAYPAKTPTSSASVAQTKTVTQEHSSSSPQISTQTQTHEENSTITEPIESTSNASEVNNNLFASKSLKVDQESQGLTIEIESPILMHRDDKVELSITLHNKKTKVRARGILSATAEWKDQTGQIQKISSIDGNKSSDGLAAKSYNIRQYKREKFLFTSPKNVKDPILTKVEILITDKDGNKNKVQILGDQS